MHVQQLHLFAVGEVVNFSFTQGAEAGGFVISAELALGCLPQATAALSASSHCSVLWEVNSTLLDMMDLRSCVEGPTQP